MTELNGVLVAEEKKALARKEWLPGHSTDLCWVETVRILVGGFPR